MLSFELGKTKRKKKKQLIKLTLIEFKCIIKIMNETYIAT